MQLDKTSVNKTLNKAESLLKEEQGLTPAIRAIIEILILLIRGFASRLNINSNNSSIPPSADKKRKRGSQKEKSHKKPGGQHGHEGSRLEKSKNPDEIIDIKIDKTTLPAGKYREVGYEARQVIDFMISKIVTEYRAQVLENLIGKQYVAEAVFSISTKTPTYY